MGLLSKIEDKLSGSSKTDNEKQTGQSSSGLSSSQTGPTSSLQHPIQSATGKDNHTAIPGTSGSAVGAGAGLTSAGASQYGSNTTGGASQYGRDTVGLASTTDRLQNTHISGNQPSGTHTSNLSSGNDRYDSGAYGSSAQPSGTHAGSNISSRPGANDSGNYSSSTQPSGLSNISSTGSHGMSDQHHYGRDAALAAGGVGATGVGAHEANKHHGHHGHHGENLAQGSQGGYSTTGTTTSTTTSTSHNTPREPYDPFSSKGQQIAAAAGSTTDHGPTQLSQGRTDAQDHGSRSTEDAEVIRSRGGGVSNGLNSAPLRSGPHPELENRSAIPTAGGQKLGEGTSGYSDNSSSTYGTSSNQHHGRDAALATGGIGAAGVGAHEAGKHHGHHGHQGQSLGQGTQGYAGSSNSAYDNTPSSQQATQGYSGSSTSAYDNTPSSQHHGRDTALAAGGLGAAGVGAHEVNKHHRHHHASSARDPASSAYSTHTSSGTSAPYGQSGVARQQFDQPGSTSQEYSQTGGSALSSQQPLHHSQHHTGEAAALGAGAGALGAGAIGSGHGQHQQNTAAGNYGSSASSYPQQAQGLSGNTHNTSSGLGGEYGSNTSAYPTSQSHQGLTGSAGNSGIASSETSGASSGLAAAKKAAASYEAGYRDALEHLKAEQQK